MVNNIITLALGPREMTKALFKRIDQMTTCRNECISSAIQCPHRLCALMSKANVNVIILIVIIVLTLNRSSSVSSLSGSGRAFQSWSAKGDWRTSTLPVHIRWRTIRSWCSGLKWTRCTGVWFTRWMMVLR